MTTGPLRDLRVLEFAGIGPGPFAAMLLSDMGADVVSVTRPGGSALLGGADVTSRGRTTVEAELKQAPGRALVGSLAEAADVLIEGFRPGVMERLGLGPQDLLARNPRLVYGRVTGYGQEGPLSARAGHDINYISIAGALGATRRAGERPMFPLNLLGDYGGGGMLLALGVLAALVHARARGQGQVVDAAMVDGVSQLATIVHGLHARGMWSSQQGANLLDSGAHFYEVYETSDGRYVSVGALEPQFYAELLERLELPPDELPQWDRERWPSFKERLAAVFRTHTRDHWAELFAGSDACVTPVLELFEASSHPHNETRGAFLELDGATLPAPAPRFSITASGYARSRVASGEQVLARWSATATQDSS